jgi:glycosyltransferase involved in cell wall biosynthesis
VRLKPRVLMVTGAYYPELSGGGLQARALARALRDEAEFRVLTTSTDSSLPPHANEDGVSIRRIYVDPNRLLSQLRAFATLVAAFLDAAPHIDIVNVHGFSRKATVLVALSRLLRKKFVLTLATGVHDEPPAARALGPQAFWAYTHADLYFSVSPGLSQAYVNAGLDRGRLRQVRNGVDIERFRPASPAEKRALRLKLGLSDAPVVLFVGFFSRDKRPDLLYRAWSRTAAACSSTLVFVGATEKTYVEVDPGLVDDIRTAAAADGIADRVVFAGATRRIDEYFRAADVYVLPSIREGSPVSLLEAMSSALPVIATRIPGSTDVLIDPTASGVLVEPDDADGFARAIGSVLTDTDAAARLGEAARRTILDRYSIQRTAVAWLDGYRELLSA